MTKANKGHIFNENRMLKKTASSDYLGSRNQIFTVHSKIKIYYQQFTNIKNVDITTFVKNGLYC